MFHVDIGCGLKKAEVSDKRQVLLRTTSGTQPGRADRLHPRATIEALPDNVLLETFELHLGKDDADEVYSNRNYDGWQTLVHVCHRWRYIVFASPRRLDLRLFCTQQRLVNSKALDNWPALHIVILAKDMKSKEDTTNIIAALRHHNRVRKVYYSNGQFQDSFLREFATINEPFPALTSLGLLSFAQNVPVLPDSFLGRSAPRLGSLHLFGIPYPLIGKLLSSTTNLVQLTLWRIPHSGYISPRTIVSCLSMLPMLKFLRLGFRYPRSLAHRASRHPPPMTRVIFPNLIILRFGGDIEYLEDMLSQIETPMLNQSDFCFFNRLVFDTPLLEQLMRRTETFMTFHTARVQFLDWAVVVTLSEQEQMDLNIRQALRLEISCKALDWQISAVSQVLNRFPPSLPILESLNIEVSHGDWQGEIEVTQWREFFHPFNSVKGMTLVFGDSIRLIAPAIQELARERATEVLPALQDIFLRTYDWQPSGPVKEAIQQLISTRQLHGHPVTVHY